MLVSYEAVTQGGDKMDDKTFSIKAIASMMNWTIEELAEKSGISKNRLNNISAERTPITLSEAQKLSELTGVPISLIQA